MVDIIEYAVKNRCSVTTTPMFEQDKETGLKRLHAWKVKIEGESGKCERVVDCITPETLDHMLAQIGSRKASHYGNIEKSRRRAEMEKFWKDGRAIFVSENKI